MQWINGYQSRQFLAQQETRIKIKCASRRMVCVWLSLAGVAIHAQNPVPSPAPDRRTIPSSTHSSQPTGDMRVHRDPETGELLDRPISSEQFTTPEKKSPDKATAEGRVYVHPSTHELVDYPVTEAQQRARTKISKMLQEDTSGLPLRVLPNGTWEITLDDRYMEAMRDEVASDGTHKASCGDANSVPAETVNEHKPQTPTFGAEDR